MKPPLFSGKNDDWQTPAMPFYPGALPAARLGNLGCACGNGNLVKAFTALGFQCFGTDAISHQYFQWYEPGPFDVIITNRALFA
jgi:hypothetical protein